MELENLSEESRRVIHAFGVTAFDAISPSTFLGQLSDGTRIQWLLDSDGKLVNVALGKERLSCVVCRQEGIWRGGRIPPFDKVMAQGLITLGFDNEVVGIFQPAVLPHIQQWAHKFTRIWKPEGLSGDDSFDWLDWYFLFSCQIEQGVTLTLFLYVVNEEVLPPNVSLDGEGGSLECYSVTREEYIREPEPVEITIDDLHTNSSENDELKLREFNLKWLDFFRRGCWLSGCPIEATAHEKAEWMQGFPREEIEAWKI